MIQVLRDNLAEGTLIWPLRESVARPSERERRSAHSVRSNKTELFCFLLRPESGDMAAVKAVRQVFQEAGRQACEVAAPDMQVADLD